jgi:hypothetical protein
MPTTLKELLSLCTVPVLKDLIMNLDDGNPTGRKEELIQQILDTMLGFRMKTVWQRLDSLQQAAVSEAAHDPNGQYLPHRFRARYGREPGFTISGTKSHGYSGSRASALGLFIHFRGADRRYLIPDDLRKQLIAFVPEPEPMTVKRMEELTDFDDQTVRLGERDALQEVMVMLRLIDQSRVAVSDKTALPSTAAMRSLTEKLVGGDFYPWIEKQNKWDQQIGPIRAFAWPLLLQAGGLVTLVSGRLTLTPAGTKALSSQPAEVLRTLWRKWLKTSLLDEFSRIDEIKGQNAKGRGMTAVAPRRAAIGDALASCPTGRWVDIDEFSRFMVASDRVFHVSHDPWKLYVGDREYGSLGYDGFNGWNILQGRYIAALLLEYAATLGMIDVALIDPAGASDDFRSLWGTDDLAYLSRYDGLCAIRLTPLGAYILGIADNYQPAPMVSTVRLSVMPSLVITVDQGAQGALNGEEQLVLETWATPLTAGSWRLDREVALSAIEKGHDITELQTFLQDRDDMPLPDTVESLIRHCQRNGNALKLQGNAQLIQCRDEAMAELLASHKETAELCLRAAPKMLVVRSQHLEKFRDRARILGFGMVA